MKHRVAIPFSLLLVAGCLPAVGQTEAPSQPVASLAATPAAVAEAKPAPPPVPVLSVQEQVDQLSDADTKQAIELIKSNFLNAGAVSESGLARATLQGLIDRLGPGISIQEVSQEVTEVSPIRAEILDDRIGYIRLGSLSQDHLQEFDATLANFVSKGLRSLILDLRATPPSSDFELTAEYLKRFTPKGKMLFTIRRPSVKQERIVTSSQEPAFQGIIVTLVNQDTAGAGEIIAGVLRTLNNSLVVGQRTAGEAAEFADFPLRGGKQVRIAVTEVKLPEDLTIFPKGLKPDLEVRVSRRTEAEVLKIGLEKGVGSLVWETERARRNEAALVAGINPELDEANRRSSKSVYDATLQRAVDLITAIGIFTKNAK